MTEVVSALYLRELIAPHCAQAMRAQLSALVSTRLQAPEDLRELRLFDFPCLGVWGLPGYCHCVLALQGASLRSLLGRSDGLSTESPQN